MKTALTQAIAEIEERISDVRQNEHLEQEFKDGVICGLKCAIMEASALLPAEKEQIERAYNVGSEDGAGDSHGDQPEHETASDYFNKTHNNEMKTAKEQVLEVYPDAVCMSIDYGHAVYKTQHDVLHTSIGMAKHTANTYAKAWESALNNIKTNHI